MNLFSKIFFSLIITVLISGCTTKGTVVVRTTPSDAQVYYFDTQSGQNSLLGTSPLTFSKSIAADNNSEILQLRVEKEGYESKYTSVATFGKETTFLDVKLSTTLSSNAELRKAFEINRQLMLEINRLTANKRFSEALSRVEKVIEVDPKNDEALAAKGSLLYLMKDYEGALGSWRKALESNPSNDAVRSSIVDLNISLAGTIESQSGSQIKNEKRIPALTTEGR